MKVEVSLKKDFSSARNKKTLEEIISAGLKAESAFPVKIYEIKGKTRRSETLRLSRELLCDPVSEVLFAENAARFGGWKVEIWLRKGITDAEAESIAEAAEEMGFSEISEIRSGKGFYFITRENEGKIRKVFEKNFSNPLVNEIKIFKL